MNAIIRLLIWIGLTSRLPNGKLFVPFNGPARHHWRSWRDLWAYMRFNGPFYVFRNRPGVVKWIPGRLLPRRWGFGVFGFEFGDRGVR